MKIVCPPFLSRQCPPPEMSASHPCSVASWMSCLCDFLPLIAPSSLPLRWVQSPVVKPGTDPEVSQEPDPEADSGEPYESVTNVIGHECVPYSVWHEIAR